MTFYILDHGPAPTLVASSPTPTLIPWVRYGWADGSRPFTVAAQSKVIATRPTQRAAEELVELLRRQSQEKTNAR